ncbi:Mfs1.1 [Epithele typhae]|uniref:Mfs1.1 n=1 Tax=Epithele typhae TaxID=378194 RepID=UPI0020087FBA|nr:Mfs1.1 [Epithele typhae]KAH9929006.1 Mfs1.1 [Epithele typhae]
MSTIAEKSAQPPSSDISRVSAASREDDDHVPPAALPEASASTPKTARFWIVLTGLVVALFVAVLEGYAVSTALPVMVNDLHTDQFIWVASTYAIVGTSLLPLVGGLTEAFGRKPVILGALLLFMAGAAVCGSAPNISVLIAGRALHGAGAGGILSCTQIVLSDLVTLQERGTYNGLFGLVWAIGGGLGPLVGGALAKPTLWRWIFYLNIPIAGLAALVLLVFLDLPRPSSRSALDCLKSLDVIGNTLIIGASCAIAIAITWAGVQFPWSSAQVLAPLIIGGVSLVLWFVYETRLATHPAVPMVILSNRTSLSGFVQIFVAAFINITLVYYLPVYYQACKDASPIASGVDLLGLCFATGGFAILTGVSVAALKRYRPQLWASWALIMLGLGLLSSLTADSPRGASIGYQVLVGVGVGMVYSGGYFPVLAPLPATLNAPALAFYVFVRSFAQIWGITVSGVLLQNTLAARLPPSVAALAPSGLANAAYTVVPLVSKLPQPERDETRAAFAAGLADVWRVALGAAAVGLLASVLMEGLPLHTERDARWAARGAEPKGLGEEKAGDAEVQVVDT